MTDVCFRLQTRLEKPGQAVWWVRACSAMCHARCQYGLQGARPHGARQRKHDGVEEVEASRLAGRCTEDEASRGIGTCIQAPRADNSDNSSVHMTHRVHACVQPLYTPATSGLSKCGAKGDARRTFVKNDVLASIWQCLQQGFEDGALPQRPWHEMQARAQLQPSAQLTKRCPRRAARRPVQGSVQRRRHCAACSRLRRLGWRAGSACTRRSGEVRQRWML